MNSIKQWFANINWKVRFQNPNFWRGLIAAIGMFMVAIFALLGVDASSEINELQTSLGLIVTSVFSIFNLLGVVTDPTTEGMCDSQQALTYETPKKKQEVQ